MKVALAKQMHDTDKNAVEEYGLPELSLMESAGHRVFEATKNILGGVSKKSVCICARGGKISVKCGRTRENFSFGQ